MLRIFLFSILFLTTLQAIGQKGSQPDTTTSKRLKIDHAEPLYIDLIRDLGAHKGEKEWNIGAGITDNLGYDRYEFLVEYEWAPFDRLGLEVEVPVSIYSSNNRDPEPLANQPSDRVESLKLAAQYTFLVSERFQTSMAFGTITEFELTDLHKIGKEKLLEGFLLNPFLIMAKRWGSSMHSLIYTGPRLHFPIQGHEKHIGYELNTSVHYMLPNSRNFIGIELNKEFSESGFNMVARPQMRLSIKEGLLVGIVPGIPLSRGDERFSSFIRLIYEPKHR